MTLRYSLCLLAGAFSLGIVPRLPSSAFLASVFAVAVICHVRTPLRLLGAFLLGLSLQWGAATFAIADRLPLELERQTIDLQAVIGDFPLLRGESLRFVAVTIGDVELPRRIRLNWYEAETVPEIGETWSLRVRLRRPRGFANPGGFDYESWLFRQGIGATGYVVASENNSKLTGRPAHLSERLRQHVVDRILSLLPNDDATAVLLAIGVGARHHISRQQWDQYAATGVSHLMAISGMHIGLAAGGAFVLFWAMSAAVARNANARDIAMWLALLVAVAYAELSGFAVPARRAFLMALLAVVTLSLRRRLNSGVVIASVCVLVVITDPLSIHTPGFQLSFAAVALLLWSNRWYQRPSDATGSGVMNQLVDAVRRLTALQLVLLLGLFPLIAITFGRFAWLAPVVNLLALPIFNFVTVPACLLGILLDGPVSSAGDQLLRLSHASVGLMLRVVSAVAEWPATRIELPALSAPMVIAALLVAGGVILPRGWPCRHYALLLLLAVLQYRPQRPPQDCVDVHVLDVGQGLAAVLQTRNRVAVYDTGPAFRSGGDTGQLIISPFLRSLGIRRIDALVVSHGDLDHAGGTASLIRDFRVSQVLAGELLELPGQPQRLCTSAQQWYWDGVRFEFVHPLPGENRDGNDGSCVLLVSSGSRHALLTGDIGRQVERKLLERRILPQIDLVTVPHHGSRTSSGSGFVAHISASVAVVSSGYRNRWQFPRPDVVERWEASGSRLLTTAGSGAVSQRLCRNVPLFATSEARVRKRRYWHE